MICLLCSYAAPSYSSVFSYPVNDHEYPMYTCMTDFVESNYILMHVGSYKK